MTQKKITYHDVEGNEITEDFYFNLNEAEITEMVVSYPGGLEEYIAKAVRDRNVGEVVKAFKDIILRSYGEKSLDGKRLDKSEEMRTKFMNSDAYNVLFVELFSDTEGKKAMDFVRSVIPREKAKGIPQAN